MKAFGCDNTAILGFYVGFGYASSCVCLEYVDAYVLLLVLNDLGMVVSGMILSSVVNQQVTLKFNISYL